MIFWSSGKTTGVAAVFSLSIHLPPVYLILPTTIADTYDHRVWKIGLPVRSAVLKPHAGELVVGWVTTSESSLLYVFFSFCMLRGKGRSRVELLSIEEKTSYLQVCLNLRLVIISS
jgi:hypothetical protein